jgi:SAM-dependent methyltransferase
MKKYFFLMCHTLKSTSICRILQLWEIKNLSLSDKVIEFGASEIKKRNFYSYSKNFFEKNIVLSNINSKNLLFIDLEKKIKFKTKFQNVLLFNVLEHLKDYEIAIKGINKLLKKKGFFIGSTPFLYRVHGAPNDCFRFTKYILEKKILKDFKVIKTENLGYGPLTACYSIISDYTKYIPFLNNILLTLSIMIDHSIGIFVKTPLKDIYPIAIFFIAKKK